MFSNNEIAESIVALGARLREQRLAHNDSQAAFAARIGVSIPTLRDMETGSATAGLGVWLAAFWMLGRLGDVDALLASASLFDDQPTRRRARRKS
jgi:transcriptional regulator with XRE-family HTH domain